jgi:hypothetical protein
LSYKSFSELRVWQEAKALAKEVGLMPEELHISMADQCNKVGAMLTRLIQSGRKPQ